MSQKSGQTTSDGVQDDTSSQNISCEDEALVRKALKGDLESFESLVGRYQQAIYNICYYKSRNCFDAEDLAQDVYLLSLIHI